MLSLLVSGACSRGPERPRSVVIVSLDTVRADRLGCHGRADAGTPRLDALAARGARFERAMTPTPLTLPAHASLLTSRLPLRHGVRHNEIHALPEAATTLAEALRGAGLRTGSFVGTAVLSPKHGLGQGFDAHTGVEPAPGAAFVMAERSAADVNRDVLGWLDGLGGEPYFAFVHYMEAHAPYAPPEPERTRFAADPYQGEIATLDRAVGELLDGLAARGLADSTLVVVVADHGEGLGEHGELSHGAFLYESTLHVPMIVAGPGVEPAQAIATPVSLVDVMPTVLDALDVPQPADLDGVSLWATLSRGSPAAADRPLYAETFMGRIDFGWSELRAIRRGEWKYVEAPRPELYDLAADPGEERDAFAAETARAESLRDALHAAMTAEGSGPAPDWPELSAAEREALQSLGYVSGSHAGATPSTLPDPKDRIEDLAALQRGIGAAGSGRLDEAERELRPLVAARPEMIEARVSLLGVLVKRGLDDEAMALAQEGLRQAAALPAGEAMASRLHLELARLHLREGRAPEAAAEFEHAVAGPQIPETHLTLAVLYLDLGRRDDALRVLGGMRQRGLATRYSDALLAWLQGRGPQPPASWLRDDPRR